MDVQNITLKDIDQIVQKVNEEPMEKYQKIIDKLNASNKEYAMQRVKDMMDDHWWNGFGTGYVSGFTTCIILSGIFCGVKFLTKK